MKHATIKLGLAPGAVIGAFCALRQVSEATMLRDPCQTRAITVERRKLMWLIHNLTTASLETIGRLFDRHSSTVWEAIGKVSDQCATDPDYRRDLRELREAIIHHTASPPLLSIDPRASAARVVAAVSVLRDQQLSDLEARHAALTILSNIMEAPHG
jgi:hypothetical protein